MRIATFLVCLSLVVVPILTVATNNKQIFPANIFLCGMTKALRQNMLDSHNQLRQQVASGGQSGQPAASNMKVMKYNLELEGYASKWASTCPNGHNPKRKDLAGNYFGENIYYSWSSQKPTSLLPSDATDAVNAWFSEVKDFQSSSINPYQFSDATGHYTQVMWAATDQVGCGIILSKDTRADYIKFPYKTTIVCNYRVGGNLVGTGSMMYAAGNGCSSCSSTCNTKYNALCGQPSNYGVVANLGSCGPYAPKSSNSQKQIVQPQSQSTASTTQNSPTNSNQTTYSSQPTPSKSVVSTSSQVTPTISATLKTSAFPSNIYFCGMTQASRQNMVDAHNLLRQKVASGSQSGQPSASNMKVMKYSLALEQYASKWASNCPNDHNPNRTDGSGTYFGENIYFSWTSQKPTGIDASVATDSVNAWFSEVQYFQTSSINPYIFGEATGHYTQVMWADTDQVGCGIVLCNDSRPTYASYPYQTIVVCNYQSGGNVVGPGSKMYATGAGCSSCSSTCNPKYNGINSISYEALCGQPTNYGVTADAGSCGPFSAST